MTAAALAFGDSVCRPVTCGRWSRAGARRPMADSVVSVTTRPAAARATDASAAGGDEEAAMDAPSIGAAATPRVGGLPH